MLLTSCNALASLTLSAEHNATYEFPISINSDSWVLDFFTLQWEEIPPNFGAPGPRTAHAMTVDENGVIWVFGGFNNTFANPVSDLWNFDGGTWNLVIAGNLLLPVSTRMLTHLQTGRLAVLLRDTVISWSLLTMATSGCSTGDTDTPSTPTCGDTTLELGRGARSRRPTLRLNPSAKGERYLSMGSSHSMEGRREEEVR